MKIIFSNRATSLLEKLTLVLAAKYFSYEFEATDYIERLRDEAKNSITILATNLPKAGKKYQATKYGNPTHFVRYKVNSRTTWYILVRINGDKALVTYIHNNNDKVHSTKA